MDEKDLKVLKEISREHNTIPPCKTISHKKQYKRERKSTLDYLLEVEEDINGKIKRVGMEF